MSYAVVQNPQGQGTGTAQVTLNVTAGNLIAVFSAGLTAGGQVLSAPTVTASRVTFSAGGVAGDSPDATNFTCIDSHFGVAASTGSTTVTVDYTAEDPAVVANIIVVEFSGTLNASPLRTHHEANAQSGNPTSGNLVATNGDLLVGATAFLGTSAATGAGFTTIINDTTHTPKMSVEYKTATGTGATTWTGTALTAWGAAALAIKPAPAVAATSPIAALIGADII